MSEDDWAVEVVRQAAEAAHALHEAGVIHRDIEPGNILLTADGGHAVLADLGLAQLADESAASGKELRRLTHEIAVTAASFSPDGRTVVTASKDNTARLWDADFPSVPDDADPDRLRAWVLVRTGQDFTEVGALRPLTPQEGRHQWETLEARGGDWQKPPDLRQWHLDQAADAEANKAWFAARFHLNRLLLTDPNNADLLCRRNEAEAHLSSGPKAPAKSTPGSVGSQAP